MNERDQAAYTLTTIRWSSVRAMKRQYSKGMTFPELMVTIAVFGIISAMGVPSFQKMIERNQLKEAAESFKSDMLLARTESFKRSQNVLISRTTGNAGVWCYGLSADAVNPVCDCTQALAPGNCNIKRVSGAGFNETNMDTAAINDNTFDFRRGTIGNNGVTFSTNNYSARVVFSGAGRVRVCTPVGSVGLTDYPDC